LQTNISNPVQNPDKYNSAERKSVYMNCSNSTTFPSSTSF